MACRVKLYSPNLSNIVEKTCEICGKVEHLPPSRAKVYKTCSLSCRNKLISIKLTKEKIVKVCSICGKEFMQKLSDVGRIKHCSKECSYKSLKERYIGVNNPACKYKTIDHNYFKNVNSEFKAYLLGWICSDGHVSKNNVKIAIRDYDYQLLNTLRQVICKDLPIKYYNPTKSVSLTICSKTWVNDICNLLQIKPGKKSAVVKFPELENDFLKWSFLRGVFDGDGSIMSSKMGSTYPKCNITSNSHDLLKSIENFANTNCYVSYKHNFINFNGEYAMVFLNKLYANSNYRLSRKYNTYLDWVCWEPGVFGHKSYKEDAIRFVKTRRHSIIPTCAEHGYKIYATDNFEVVYNNVVSYNIGIRAVPHGKFWYDFELDKDLYNRGYRLLEPFVPIGATNHSTINLLLKTDGVNCENIKTPFIIGELVKKEIVRPRIVEVNTL
jgi:hypothetical protein